MKKIKISNNLFDFILQFLQNSKFIIFILILSLFCIDITFVWLHPHLMENIIKSIESLNTLSIQNSLIYYVLMWIGLLFLGFIEDITSLYTTEKISINVKRVLLNYVNKHSVNYFRENKGHVIINKINDISIGVSNVIKKLFISSIIFVFTQIIVFHIFYKSSKVLFYYSFGATMFYLLIVFLFNKHTKKTILKLQEDNSNVFGKMNDEIKNILEIKSFGNEKTETAILSKSIKETYTTTKELTFLKVRVKFVKDLSAMLLIFVNVAVLFYLRIIYNVDVSFVVLIIGMTVAMMQFNRNFAQKLLEGIDTYRITENNLEYIVKPISIQNKENAIDLEKENIQLQGKIEFKGVDFSHKKNENIIEEEGAEEEGAEEKEKLFDNLTVIIEKGSKIGLTGSTGSGKTTFINLIMRYLNIDGGYIIFDDKYDIRDITQESLRKNITYIKQDTNLFARSIKENIAYGKLDATEEEIFDVAKKAGCYEFIEGLKDKFETIIEKDGLKLSAGQEKQIIMARSMLKNSPILIIDSFLNDMDILTEAKISEAFDNLTKDKTVIEISYDLSNFKNMDKILVFDNGEIIEEGTHEELINKKYKGESGDMIDGVYKQMWESQMESFSNESGMKKIQNKVKDILTNLSDFIKK